MSASETLSASLEDYLEAIYHIIIEKSAVKPKDIAKKLKVSNASVTGALRGLATRGLINYAPYDVISLTPEGKVTAKDVVRRHEALKDFFVRVLAVDETEADTAACQMEHCVTKVILDRFIRFAEFVDGCPRGGSKWISGFGYNCDHDSDMSNCEECILATLNEVKNIRKERQGEMTQTVLSSLKPNQKGKVRKIRSKALSGRRFVEMGLTPGSIVEVVRVAPLGDPIDLKVKGYHLSVRKEDAAQIDVDLLP